MQGSVFEIEQPYVIGCAVPLDAVFAAAGKVSREWGDYGYKLSIEGAAVGSYLFGVRHLDGSEFFLLSDRYGNVRHVEWDGARWQPIDRPSHCERCGERLHGIVERQDPEWSLCPDCADSAVLG